MLRVESRLKAAQRYVQSGDKYKHMVRRYDIGLNIGRDKRYVDMERVWASGYDWKQMTLDSGFYDTFCLLVRNLRRLIDTVITPIKRPHFWIFY